MSKKLKKFIIKSKKKHGNKYDYSKVDYVHSRIPVTITCPEHGDYDLCPEIHTHTKHARGCPTCVAVKNQNNFIKKSKMKFGDKFTYDKVNYINSRTDVTITCRLHDCDISIQPRHHLFRGNGCPKCSTKFSLHEKMIMELLETHNIKYDVQKTFKNLKSDKGYFLRFDFYIPSKNIVIEYDGKQHYEHLVGWVTEENYIRLVANDKLKNNYCSNNKIHMLRIPYYETDIEGIILRRLGITK